MRCLFIHTIAYQKNYNRHVVFAYYSFSHLSIYHCVVSFNDSAFCYFFQDKNWYQRFCNAYDSAVASRSICCVSPLGKCWFLCADYAASGNRIFVDSFRGYGILLPVFRVQLFFMKKTSFVRYLSWWIISALILAFVPFGPGKIFLRELFFPLIPVDVLQLQLL